MLLIYRYVFIKIAGGRGCGYVIHLHGGYVLGATHTGHVYHNDN